MYHGYQEKMSTLYSFPITRNVQLGYMAISPCPTQVFGLVALIAHFLIAHL